MKRNTVVLGLTLLVLAVFAWAGWANWEYRKQAAERREAARVRLIPASADDAPDASLSDSALVGKPAPAFTLENLSGQKVSLADYKGKALLINFWATWCGPCKLETPWLVELRNKYAPQGFEILGVSTDDLDPDDKQEFATEKKEIAHFVDQMHMPYPVLIGGATIAKPYGGLDAMPTSFYVTRKGTVVAMRMGITSKDDIEARIQSALGDAR